MTIDEIKAAISAQLKITVGTTSMVRQFDEVTDAEGKVTKTPSVWVSHWDNNARFRMTMHEDIMAQIVASNKTKSDLAFKYELVTPTGKAPYHRFIVITPRDIEATF